MDDTKPTLTVEDLMKARELLYGEELARRRNGEVVITRPASMGKTTFLDPASVGMIFSGGFDGLEEIPRPGQRRGISKPLLWNPDPVEKRRIANKAARKARVKANRRRNGRK